jgi:hypothetical protein
VQIDGSEHAWFEDRGPPCTLLAFVDDATSRLLQMRFVTSESTFDYFRTTRAYLEQHGKPVALYSDKHGIFRVNSKEAAGGDGVTQFGRALLALNIDIICANSPRTARADGGVPDVRHTFTSVATIVSNPASSASRATVLISAARHPTPGMNRGDDQPGFGAGNRSLKVFGEAAVAIEPGEGPFDQHPADKPRVDNDAEPTAYRGSGARHFVRGLLDRGE